MAAFEERCRDLLQASRLFVLLGGLGIGHLQLAKRACRSNKCSQGVRTTKLRATTTRQKVAEW